MVDGASFRSIYSLQGKNILYNIIKLDNPNVTDAEFVKSPKLLAKAGGEVAMRFAAQMINLARPFVTPMTAAQANASVATAQVTTVRQRMVQNKDITLVLQILLGVVLLCFLVVALGVDTKVGITKSPGSIGAQAGLLADSELVRIAKQQMERCPPGVTLSDRDLCAAWESYVISLGWWDVERENVSVVDAKSVEEGKKNVSVVDVKNVEEGGVRQHERYGIDVGCAKRRR
jgi:hypothetical protein